MKWKTLFTKITIWLALEIVLTLIGLDDIADYSEFLSSQESNFVCHNPVQLIVA